MKKKITAIIVVLLLIGFIIESLILFRVINLEKIRSLALSSRKPRKVIVEKSISVADQIEQKISQPLDVDTTVVPAKKAKKARERVPQNPIELFVDEYIKNLKKYPESLGFSYANLGILALKSGEYQRAIHYFSLAHKARPDDSENIFNLSVAYYKVGNKKKMYEYLTKAYKLQPTDDRIAELYGYYSYKNKAIDRAKEAYIRLYKKKNPRAFVMLGNIYMMLKDYEKGVEVYRKALDSKIFSTRTKGVVAYNIGNSYFMLKKYDNAIRYYDLALNYGMSEAYFNKGMALYKLARIKEAFNAFYHYRGSGFDKEFMLGNCYYLLGNYEKAFRAFNKLYSKGVRDEALIYNLLMTAYKLKDTEALRKYLLEYEKVSDKVEDIKYFYKVLGKLFYDLADYDKAIEIFQRALGKFGDTEKDFLYLLGLTYEQSTEYKKALEYYSKILPSKKYADVYYRIAYIKYKTGDIDAAANVLEDMKASFGENADILYLLGDIYYKKKVYDKAIYFFNRVINGFKDKKAVALSYAKLAEIYDEREDYNLALEFINKAIDTDSGNPGFYYNRAIIYHHKGDLVDAKDSLLRAKALLGQFDEDIYINLGNIYFELGDFKKAKQYYEDVLKHSPDNIEAAYNLNQVLKVEGQINKK